MNPKVHDFPALIHWIAETYHGGAVHPIHEAVGVSPALVQLWSKGGVKNPNLESLERLCRAYRLEFDFVRGLLRRPKRVPHPIAGGSDATGTGGVVELPEKTTPYRTLRDWLKTWWAPALQPQWA